MSPMKRILIAGGGPAGALCGERLAQAGFEVLIFEERLGWEKPCGGGVTWKTLERYPFLLQGGVEKKLLHRAELIAPGGRRAPLQLTRPLALYSRATLNGFLLRRAQAAGCRVVEERVLGAEGNGCLRLRTARQEYGGDFIVLATGARNPIRIGRRDQAESEAQVRTRAARDLEQTLGYFVPREDDALRIAFLENFEGYLWSFPRPGHLSVGICGRIEQDGRRVPVAEMQQKLDRFLAAEGIPTSGAQLFSHLLPSLAPGRWDGLVLGGPGWAQVGDAAGLVDPVTGEGIYYAMRSGELLAEALRAGQPEAYAARVRSDFLPELDRAARWQHYFFRGRLLGAGVTTRLVELLGRSPTFAALVDDLVAGTQSYRGLQWRLARIALPMLGEVVEGHRRDACATEACATEACATDPCATPVQEQTGE